MESADSPSTVPSSATPDARVRPALGTILVSHFLCTLGFAVFSLLPKYLMTARGLSQAQTGPASMGLPLGALLFSPLVAVAMRRYPKAALVRGSALCFAAVTAIFALTPDPALIPLLTVLLGGACMGVFNGGAGLTAEVAPDHGMARALGLHGASGMLGHALGPLALEPLAASRGWSTAFLVAAASAALGSLLPLPAGQVRVGRVEASFAFLRSLRAVLAVALLVGVMHNALWTAHQPLVLARGGHEMRGYFLGMSFGALGMRVAFGGLPDRIGHGRATLYALTLYVAAALGMTWVTPETLPAFGLLHGVAHGVFYPALAALAASRVSLPARGEALTAMYAAFNVGATIASVSFARVGESYGPASVFPCAAAIGLLGWGTLRASLSQASRSFLSRR